MEIETDEVRRREIENSISEGELILKSGRKISGKKMTQAEFEMVRRAVENSKKKLGIL